MERDHAVDTVKKLWPKKLLRGGNIVSLVIRGNKTKRTAGLLRTQIGSHHNDRVAKVGCASQGIRQAAFAQHLQ